MKPGSFLWLLAHDIKLNWRMLADVMSAWSVPWRIGAAVTVAVAVHLIAGGVLLIESTSRALTVTDNVGLIAATGGAFWMVSQGLLGGARALYQRGELELLLSSPLPVWKPVAARAVSVAASSFGSLAPFLLPLANAGAVLDTPRWLVLYPISIALALAGTAIGFVISVALFYLVGPRFARAVAQVTAAVLAGAFVLGLQLAAIIPTSAAEIGAGALAALGTITPDIGLQRSIRHIVSGDPLAVSWFFVSSAVAFLLALRLTAAAFVKAACAAAGAPAATRETTVPRPFREGPFTALRLKEWRLLSRDPNLVAQLGLQIVYTLPVAVILLRSPSAIPPAVALVPLIVVLAAQVCASLAWLSVSGEDAPELLATAPLKAGRCEVAKLSAIAWPLLLILAIPAGVLAVIEPRALVYAVVFGALAAGSTALLNFWHPLPGNRRGMLRRHSQSKLVAIAEHGMALLWACATVMAMMGTLATLVPVALIGLILWGFKPKNRSIRAAVGAPRGTTHRAAAAIP